MILVDTSIWVDHLHRPDRLLVALLKRRQVLMHPHVLGEVALGTLRQRGMVMESLAELPHARVAEDHEVLTFINHHRLFGLGVGYVDVHLIVAAKLTPETTLWTRDKRLLAVAVRLSLASRPHDA